MTLKDGETVGAYRIIGQLGQGGMATVYKAYHAGLDRYVAIKVLHPAFKEDSTFLGRFQREARVLAKLDHPNIVPIYDFAEHDGQPYLVMKYVEGETLKGRLARGPITREETLQIVESVGAALAYAHQQGILHRDVKPSNVIITSDKHYYLSDFGLARMAASGESTLSQDTLLGTPNYISPEQARGLTDLDGRTDIYSLGVVLYELIVGRVPFSGDTPYSIIHDHIFTPLPPPSGVNPAVSQALERFLLKSLAKDRGDRYQDVPEMVEAFRRAARAGIEDAQSSPDATEALSQTLPRLAVAPAVPDNSPAALPQETKVAATVVRTSGQNKPWWLLGSSAVVLLALVAVVFVAGRLLRPGRSVGTPTVAVVTSVKATLRSPTPGPATITPVATAAGAIATVIPAETAAAANPNSVDDFVQLGRSLYRAGKFKEAAIAYGKAAELQHYRGIFYLNQVLNPYQSDPVFALTVLADGLEHSTDQRTSNELWIMAGAVLEKAAESGNSEPILASLSQDFPDRLGPEAALAQHYVLFGQYDKAKRTLDRLKAKWPDDAHTQFVWAEYDAAQGQLDQAEAEYNAVIANTNAPAALQLAAQSKLNQLKGTSTP